MAMETIARALAALREGRLDDAETLSRELLNVAPRDPAAHQLAAAVALQRGRFSEADRRARSCLALRPDHVPAILLAGRAARASRDFARAKALLRRAVHMSSDKPEAPFQLALAQIESSDPDVTATLAMLAQRFPGEAEGWRDIGIALMHVDQLEGAEMAFTRAANASNDPTHRLNLGRVLLAKRRPNEAVTALRHVLAAAPDRIEALLPLAQALRQIGAPHEARQYLQRLVAIQPDKAQIFYVLGLICDDLRDWPDAIAAYRRCLDLEPQMPEAHVNLGLALQQIGELEQAIHCYREALRLRPDTFGRIAQALPSTQKGTLWLSTRKLRRSLGV
jgi:tetratricopeptide (TPR) repeat protein